MKDYYTVKDYALLLKVHPQTLRRYTRQGLVLCSRTLGNHRRFEIPKPVEGKVVGYVRVSSKDQENDLNVQEKALAVKANAIGIKLDITIKDIGSGMNYKKKGFTLLLDLLFKKQIGTLVLMHKDRLLRFGSELIFKLCTHLGVRVVILEPSSAKAPLEQLSLDLVEIITVFSAKVYGMRSHANKVVLTSS